MWSINPHSGYTSSRVFINELYNVSDPTLYPQTIWNNDRYLSYKKTKIYKTSRFNLVTPCKWLADLVQNTSLGQNSIEIIPNGIDTEVFKIQDKSNLKKKLGFDNSPVILFIGAAATTNKFKGYEDFLWMSSQEKFSNCQFICLGACESGRAQNLFFVKATSNKKVIAEYLSCADVLVMPSRFETFPLVILEAMACGTPVVAYDVGGASEVLKRAPYCHLVATNNKYSLLEATKAVLGLDKSLIMNASVKLSHIIEQSYSKNHMVNQYIKLYSSLLDVGRE
jgi:glycosyltransferase involved in cell wall biosynthesis